MLLYISRLIPLLLISIWQKGVVNCGELTTFATFNGKDTEIIKSFEIDSKLQCGHHCSLHPTCEGVDTREKSENGKHVCKLLKTMHGASGKSAVSDSEPKSADLLMIVKRPCTKALHSLLNISEPGVHCFHVNGLNIPLISEIDENRKAWFVIQSRFDGSMNFSRDWQSYKKGFGYVLGEFWLGNDNIHELTKNGNMKIRFDLFDGTEERYAEYDSFSISSEADNYRLFLGTYSGTAGDAMEEHRNQTFSTPDRDNDPYTVEHCANSYKGGWWYNKCHRANLNGLYLDGTTNIFAKGMVWYHWHGYYFSMIRAAMKIAVK